jgi:hypothetical protein
MQVGVRLCLFCMLSMLGGGMLCRITWHLKDSDERAAAYIAGPAPCRWVRAGVFCCVLLVEHVGRAYALSDHVAVLDRQVVVHCCVCVHAVCT